MQDASTGRKCCLNGWDAVLRMSGRMAAAMAWVTLAVVMMTALGAGVARAQENPLGDVHTQPPPPPPKTPEERKPVVEGGR